jgi:hypothetical protein
MMRGGTRFDANQARLQFLEERQYIAALELAANHHLSLRVDAMHLKNRLKPFWVGCGAVLER